jgi:2-C-methyl-D-erythritol 4-phosphate cytidylyltransferase
MAESIDLVFLCAGRGTRVGLEDPKQFVPLCGRPVLIHSLEVFERLPIIGKKIIVHDPAEADRLDLILSAHGITDYHLVAGGNTRQESVRRGLAEVTTTRVFTHNAAVPFITPAMLNRVMSTSADCVTTSTSVQDSLVRVVEGQLQPIPRAGLCVINSPQVFRTAIFRDAHESAFRSGTKFNSDAELMLHFHHTLQLVPGPPWSFKITDRVDLALAETILQRPDLFPELRSTTAHEIPRA